MAMYKKCEMLGCIVGPAICKKCGHCDDPCERETVDEKPRKTARSERLRKRAEAIRVLERKLKAACLYAPTGFAIRSASQQRKDVSSRISSKVVSDEAEKHTLTFDFGDIEDELECAV